MARQVMLSGQTKPTGAAATGADWASRVQRGKMAEQAGGGDEQDQDAEQDRQPAVPFTHLEVSDCQTGRELKICGRSCLEHQTPRRQTGWLRRPLPAVTSPRIACAIRGRPHY